jgi:HK97 family phage prohead protease
MTKVKEEIIERKVGEKVQLSLGLDNSLTKDLGDGLLETVVTTTALDRHNESIDSSGVNTDSYMANPVVLYGHDYASLPIGKAVSLTKSDNSITAKFQLAVEEYPFAKTVYDLIKGGYLNAVSIGGVVREWSQDMKTILKMDMVEFSVVPVPANPEAIITGRSFEEATGKSFEQFNAECQEALKSVVLDKVKSMPNNEMQTTISVLKNLTATLEDISKDESSAGELIAEAPELKHIKTVRKVELLKAINRESEKGLRTIKLKRKE